MVLLPVLPPATLSPPLASVTVSLPPTRSTATGRLLRVVMVTPAPSATTVDMPLSVLGWVRSKVPAPNSSRVAPAAAWIVSPLFNVPSVATTVVTSAPTVSLPVVRYATPVGSGPV